MDKETLTNDKRDSITMKKNAKGEYAWDIKRYYDAETMPVDDVVHALKEADTCLRGAFE